MDTTTTYICEIDNNEFADELHNLVTLGTTEERRAWFALEMAHSEVESPGLSLDTAVYAMNEYIGSSKFRTYNGLVDFLKSMGYLADSEVSFLKSGFTMSDDVICHCETCNA
jgi:hypothetical protein